MIERENAGSGIQNLKFVCKFDGLGSAEVFDFQCKIKKDKASSKVNILKNKVYFTTKHIFWIEKPFTSTKKIQNQRIWFTKQFGNLNLFGINVSFLENKQLDFWIFCFGNNLSKIAEEKQKQS